MLLQWHSMKNKLNMAWDLSPLFSADTDILMAQTREAVKKAHSDFEKKWKSNPEYLQDAEVLREALDEYEKLQHQFGSTGKEGYYFWLRSMKEENNPEIKARLNQVIDFGNQMGNMVRFFMLSLAKVDERQQKVFLQSPALSPYTHVLERLFAESKYLLSEAEEKILALKDEPSSGFWVRMVSGFIAKETGEVVDEDGKTKKKNFSEIMSLINSKKKKTRDSAAAELNSILDKHVEASEAEINAILFNKKIDDELRGIPRPDKARHISDDIDTEVVDALIAAVSSKFDIARRFYALKAKLLGQPKLAYHERNVEYGSSDKAYSYDEAYGLVEKVFSSLDPEFAEVFSRLHNSGQVDVYPGPGKRSGAFCSYWLLSQPTYVLLNHTDKLNDVLTLAHEFGHATNNELMRTKQHALNFGTPLSTAEVASTFMEDFVLDDILKSADDELRLSIQMMKLNSDISTIFRQVACYMFEQDLHHAVRAKGYVAKEEIGKIFQKHMAAYMGEAVEQSPGSENWWVYWSHIRNFFYVYSYSSGLLISKSLQASVKKDKKFIQKVKIFLSAGLSSSPKDIFAALGIDITDQSFWTKGLTEVDTLLSDTEKLAKKLGKI